MPVPATKAFSSSGQPLNIARPLVDSTIDNLAVTDSHPNLSAISKVLSIPVVASTVGPKEVCGFAGNLDQPAPVHLVILTEVAVRIAEYVAHPAFIDDDVRHCKQRKSNVEPFLGQPLARFDVEAAVVDRPTAGGRSLVLHEQHDAAGLGAQLSLVMRVGVVDHRAGAIGPAADREAAFQDVPDLRGIVPVQR